MDKKIKDSLRELRIVITIIIFFIVMAALIISFYSRMDIFNAFQTVFMQLLTAGSGGALGNAFYVALIFLTLAVTFYMFEKVIMLLTQIRLGGVLMRANLSSIKDHFIVCGAGRVGMHTAEKLKNSGKRIVIIENDCERAENMRDKGYIVVHGDCVDEDILNKAKIKKAKGLVACTSEDQKNVFVILTCKDLNPKMKVAARVNDMKAKAEFERAGADIIVMPEVTGGYELADKIVGN